MSIVHENVDLGGVDEVIETHRPQGITPLLFAARFGHIDIVRVLLQAGAQVNPEFAASAPLLAALQGRDSEGIVKVLLDAGARVNVQDRSGMTPLMLACAGDDPQSVRMLLAQGADLGLKDKDDHTAFWWAGNHPQVLALLDQARQKRTE